MKKVRPGEEAGLCDSENKDGGAMDQTTEEPTWSLEKAIRALLSIAEKSPEVTHGSVRYQIQACKMMYELGYEPALGRLSEIANTDPARTKGNRRGQESATKLLKRLASSIKVDKNQGIQ
jgi:hypothetical protein